MYGILTPSLVQEAFAMVLPLIEQTLKNYCEHGNLAVVVTGTEIINPRDQRRSFPDDYFLVAALGDQTTWERDYLNFARAKAEKSVRTGMDSAKIPPHYLRQGDIRFYGSVVRADIVVACSGAKSYEDEMFAGWIADAIIALAKKRFADLPPEQIYV